MTPCTCFLASCSPHQLTLSRQQYNRHTTSIQRNTCVTTAPVRSAYTRSSACTQKHSRQRRFDTTNSNSTLAASCNTLALVARALKICCRHGTNRTACLARLATEKRHTDRMVRTTGGKNGPKPVLAGNERTASTLHWRLTVHCLMPPTNCTETQQPCCNKHKAMYVRSCHISDLLAV